MLNESFVSLSSGIRGVGVPGIIRRQPLYLACRFTFCQRRSCVCSGGGGAFPFLGGLGAESFLQSRPVPRGHERLGGFTFAAHFGRLCCRAHDELRQEQGAEISSQG
jgi:hypothetical protein